MFKVILFLVTVMFGLSSPALAVVVHRGATAVGPRGGVYHRGVTAIGPRGGVYHRGGTYIH
jgi:hypothetical protein